MKVFCIALMCLQFGFEFFWQMTTDIPVHKIMIKLSSDDFTSTTTAATFAASDQQIHIRVSGTDIRPKEVVLVSLALLLLVLVL